MKTITVEFTDKEYELFKKAKRYGLSNADFIITMIHQNKKLKKFKEKWEKF
jgi:predicted CopG family antitoxin